MGAVTHPEGVHVVQWAKRPPLKLEVPGSNPRGWFNGRAENRDPFRWLETARGLSPIRLIGRAQCFPGRLAQAVPRLKGCPNATFRCLSEEKLGVLEVPFSGAFREEALIKR